VWDAVALRVKRYEDSNAGFFYQPANRVPRKLFSLVITHSPCLSDPLTNTHPPLTSHRQDRHEQAQSQPHYDGTAPPEQVRDSERTHLVK